MLRYSESKLNTEKAVNDLFSKVQTELNARKKLYERYRRKLSDEELASLTDEDIKVPLERYIGIMASGFYGGKAPVYKVHAFDEKKNKLDKEIFGIVGNDEQAVDEIEHIISHITNYNDDAAHHLKMTFEFLVKRACYEINYKDRDTGEYTYATSDALETVAIWDYKVPKNLIGLYRIIDTVMANGEYQTMVELTTKSGKYYYMDTPEKRKIFELGNEAYKNSKYKNEPLFKEDKKKFTASKWVDDLPIIAIEQEDGLNIFELVISLINGYERAIQNSRNTFQYNDLAILKVKGYEPENEMVIQDENGNDIINPARVLEDKYVLESRVRYLQPDGDLDWVTKDVNDNAVQNHKQTLMDLICLCSMVPNTTDLGFTKADNSSALEKKFFSLQQLIATFDSEFKKGYLRRWELILNKINKEKGKKYDFRDIEVKLLRNLPSDTKSETDRALALREILSDESVIAMLPDDLDPINEINKKKQESEDNMQENLDKIRKFGTNQQGDKKINEESSNIESEMGQDKNRTGKLSEEISEIKQENAK